MTCALPASESKWSKLLQDLSSMPTIISTVNIIPVFAVHAFGCSARLWFQACIKTTTSQNFYASFYRWTVHVKMKQQGRFVRRVHNGMLFTASPWYPQIARSPNPARLHESHPRRNNPCRMAVGESYAMSSRDSPIRIPYHNFRAWGVLWWCIYIQKNKRKRPYNQCFFFFSWYDLTKKRCQGRYHLANRCHGEYCWWLHG